MTVLVTLVTYLNGGGSIFIEGASIFYVFEPFKGHKYFLMRIYVMINALVFDEARLNLRGSEIRTVLNNPLWLTRETNAVFLVKIVMDPKSYSNEELLKYADGELDATQALEIGQYIAANPEAADLVERRKFGNQLLEVYPKLEQYAHNLISPLQQERAMTAGDLAQQTYILCLQGYQKFTASPGSSVLAWAKKNMHNHFIDVVRSHEVSKTDPTGEGNQGEKLTTGRNPRKYSGTDPDKNPPDEPVVWDEKQDEWRHERTSIKKKLRDYAKNKLSGEEKREVEQYIADNPDAKAFVEKHKKRKLLTLEQVEALMGHKSPLEKWNQEKLTRYIKKTVTPCLEKFSADEQKMLYEKGIHETFEAMAEKRNMNQNTLQSRYMKVAEAFMDCLGPFPDLVEI